MLLSLLIIEFAAFLVLCLEMDVATADNLAFSQIKRSRPRRSIWIDMKHDDFIADHCGAFVRGIAAFYFGRVLKNEHFAFSAKCFDSY